jgi:hypothetical protein
MRTYLAFPAALVMARKDRRTLPADRGVPTPTLVQNTRPWSRQVALAVLRSVSWRACRVRSASSAWAGSFRVRRDFSVLVSPPTRTERQTYRANSW